MKRKGVIHWARGMVQFGILCLFCGAHLPLTGAVAYGWGLAYHGQLGTGDCGEIYQWTPVDQDVVKVASGAGTYFLKSDNSLWVSNFSNFTLDPNADLALKFLFAEGIKDVGCGGNFLLLLKEDNSAWAAGDNSSGEDTRGQLGQGIDHSWHYNWFIPDPVLLASDVVFAVAGYENSFYITSDVDLRVRLF